MVDVADFDRAYDLRNIAQKPKCKSTLYQGANGAQRRTGASSKK